jgi:DNA polymerase III subunit epsilon
MVKGPHPRGLEDIEARFVPARFAPVSARACHPRHNRCLPNRTYVRYGAPVLAQRCFEELGTPLAGVTFCVVDLETTGGSAADSSITEIGAVKVRCGEVIGTFQTLVNPGEPVPAFIRLLTGISDDMLVEAPDIASVLPSFLEFVGGSVIVAHNARFDVSFLNANLIACGYEVLTNRIVDTAALARKVLAGETPNNKLSTLSSFLRCAHRPCHRAYEDVLATIDVLHHLIERVAGYGVTTLEDLLAVSSTRLDGTFSKIRLAEDLPRSPGVYRFLGTSGNTLYVGKSTDVRARVRSYFYGDPRRRVRDLLRETQSIVVEPHRSMLEAEVAEARAIARELPPYNRAGKRSAHWYLRVSLNRRAPKLAPARVPKRDRDLYLGPFASARVVRTLIDALRDAFAVHRCTDPARCRGCPLSEIGSCAGPSGAQRREVRRAAVAIVADPSAVVEPLRRRMWKLAGQERFEEAAEVRDRGELLERTLCREAELRALLDAGDVALVHEGRAHLIRAGQLAASVDDNAEARPLEQLHALAQSTPVHEFWSPTTRSEATAIISWLRRNAGDVRVLACERSWAMPLGAGRSLSFSKRPGGSPELTGRAFRQARDVSPI